MNKLPLANWLSISVRIYRALLVAYPKRFREHYATQIVQVFRDSFREAYQHNGVPGVIYLWFHTLADLLVTALMERLAEGSQYMFSPKVILWSAVVGVFSGMFWIMGGLAPSIGAAALMIAVVLGLGGLVSLYFRQAGQGGRLGLAGFALGIIGTILTLAALWWASTFFSGSTFREIHSRIDRESTLAARIILNIMLALVILGIGLALLGVASLRAKTLPRWPSLPLGLGLLNIILALTGWLIYYVPLSQGRNPWNQWPPEGYVFNVCVLVLLGLGWMGLGLTLATDAEARLASPTVSAETR